MLFSAGMTWCKTIDIKTSAFSDLNTSGNKGNYHIAFGSKVNVPTSETSRRTSRQVSGILPATPTPPESPHVLNMPFKKKNEFIVSSVINAIFSVVNNDIVVSFNVYLLQTTCFKLEPV